MRGALILAGALVALGLAALWLTGGFALIERLAADSQRSFQNGMAATLRDLKAGAPGATLALLAGAFAYGVVHAAGPGHGKFLIGGYGIGSRAPLTTLAGIALVSSLAQATVAVVLVYAGVLVFGWTRAQLVGAADGWLDAFSYGLIALVGLWLGWRGLRHLAALRAGPDGHDHDDHLLADGHVHGPDCGHAHVPSPADIAALRSWRDAAALIAAVAVRPCTGALFLLILTWRMGLGAAGIAGAYAMGLGTALVTLGVAAASVTMREGALAAMARSRGLALAMPVLEMVAGSAVALVAVSLLLRAL